MPLPPRPLRPEAAVGTRGASSSPWSGALRAGRGLWVSVWGPLVVALSFVPNCRRQQEMKKSEINANGCAIVNPIAIASVTLEMRTAQ